MLIRAAEAIEAALAVMMANGAAVPRPLAMVADPTGDEEAFVFVSMRTADEVRAGWAGASTTSAVSA